MLHFYKVIQAWAHASVISTCVLLDFVFIFRPITLYLILLRFPVYSLWASNF